MDPGKKKTLIEWVNSLAVDTSIQSLLQLQDGRHLLALANLIEGIPRQSDLNLEQRWDLILAYIESLYECNRLDKKAIIKDCHEFEIAKVCLLLMSAALLCERNDMFVFRAMRMEVVLQHEIREMIEAVLEPNKTLVDLDPYFHQVLLKSLEKSSGANSPNLQDLCTFEMKELDPQASSTPQSCNQRSRTAQAQATSTPTMNFARKEDIGTTPVFSTSILGRFTSPVPCQAMSPMSPVQQMVQSPHMANKIRMQQKEAKIKQLERELTSKRHLVSEYENELEEKRRDADEKEKDLRANREHLQHTLRKLEKLQMEVDDLRLASDVSMLTTHDSQRILELQSEKTELTQRNKHLEGENASLYALMHTLQDQVGQLENVQAQMSQYRLRLCESENKTCDLQTALSEREQQLKQLSEASEQAHAELAALRDNHHQELRDMHEQLDMAASNMVGTGESLGGVIEIKFAEELEMLKAEINEYEKKLQEKADHMLELLNNNQQLSNSQAELSMTNEHLDSQVKELRQELNSTQQRLSQSRDTSNLWEQKTQALETTLREFQNTSSLKITELQSQFTTSQAEKKHLRKQLTASQEAISNLQSAMQGAQEAFAQQKAVLSQQYCSAQTDIGVLENRVQSAESCLSSTQNELSTVKKQLCNAHEAFCNELQDKDTTIMNLKEHVQSSEQELCMTKRCLSQELAEKDVAFTAVTSELGNMRQDLANTQKELKNQCTEMKQASEEHSLLKAQFEEKLQAKSEQLAHVEATRANVCIQAQEEAKSHKLTQAQLEEQVRVKSEQLAQVEANRANVCKEAFEETERLKIIMTQLEEQVRLKSEGLEQAEGELQNAKDHEKELLKQLEMANTTKGQLEEQLRSKTEELSQVQVASAQQVEEKEMCVVTLRQDVQSMQAILQSKDFALEEIKVLFFESESRVKKLQELVEHHEQITKDQKMEHQQVLELANVSSIATKAQLEVQLQSMSDKLSKINITNAHQKEEYETHIMTLAQDLSSAQELIQSKEHDLDQLRLTFSGAEAQVKKLQDEVTQHVHVVTEQKKELSRQIEMATMSGSTQQEAMQKLSLELQKASMKGEASHKALESLRNECVDKEQQWNSKVDEFEKTVEQICELRQQLQENEVELRQVGGQLDHVSNQLEDTEKTRDAFMARVQEQEYAISRLNEQVLESETQAEEYNTKAVNLEKQLGAIREESVHIRQELNAECERVEAMEVELMETQQTAEQNEEDLQRKLEVAWQAQESLQSEMFSMKEKYRTMEDQCELWNQKMCEVCDSLKQSRADAEHREQELNMKLSTAEENRHAILEEFNDAQFNITTLQEELEESKDRNCSLEENIKHHKNNAELIEARLREFMEDKEGEMGTLMTELTDTDNKLKEARHQEAKVRQVLEQHQTQSVHREAEISSQLEALTMQLGDSAQKVASLEESLDVAQQALLNTEKEKEEVQQTLVQSRMSLTGKEDHLGAIQEKVRKLKEALSASDERVCQLQDTLSIYEQKSSDLEQRHQQAETEAERKEMRLESDLEKAQDEIEELTNKVCQLEKVRGEVVARFNQEEHALQEALLKESTLQQELTTTRMELSVRQESLQNLEVHHVNQVGQMENVISDVNAKGSAACVEYEQCMARLKQETLLCCQKYDAQIQELQSALQQTESAAEGTKKNYNKEMAKLEKEHKEEVKILGCKIETLSAELQSLKCWEMSERTSIKDLEEKCNNKEAELSKSRKENVVLALKLQTTEKQLTDVENRLLAEKVDLAQQLNGVNELENELRIELDSVKSELLLARAQYTDEVAKLDAKRKENISALEHQNEQLVLQYRDVSQALEEARNELEEVKRKHVEELLEVEEQCKQMEAIVEKQAKRSSQSADLVRNHEEALSQQKDEHFAHVAEVELNYQLEVERLEGEVNKFKSDTTHMQELVAAIKKKAATAENDAHAEIISLEKDKLELESKLESRDRQLKTAKTDVMRAQRLQDVKALDLAEAQQKTLKVEREMHKMMEREKRHLEAHRRETSLGADMNAKLQQQLAERELELKTRHEECNKEVRELTAQVSVMQERYNAEMEALERKNNETFDQEISNWRGKFEQLTIAFNKLEAHHATSESERQQLVEAARLADAARETECERSCKLETAVTTLRTEKEHCEVQLQEASNLKNQLREEEMINKRLGNQTRNLEAQLDFANRQLKADGFTRTRVQPPPPPVFSETPASLRRSTRNTRAKETTFDSNFSPKLSPEDITKPYELRSKMSVKDLTVTPGTEGRYFSRLSFASSLGPTPRKSPSGSSTSSGTGSTTTEQHENAQRFERLSISSNGSHESIRSNNVPLGTGALFSIEDEPTDFEWDRLSELQRRNTLCLPHLKSSYPTEVQNVKQNKISERDLQRGEPLDVSQTEGGPDTRSRSRKRTSTDVHNEENSDNQRKAFVSPSLAMASTSTLNGSSGVRLKVYPHYSPHAGNTPKHKLARSSPRGAPTPRANKATPTPATPMGKTKGVTPKGQPSPKWGRWRKGSTPDTPKNQNENETPKTKKKSMSFNIGFTPKKSKGLAQILRRKKNVDETPKGKLTAVKPTKRMAMKPLGDHNWK